MRPLFIVLPALALSSAPALSQTVSYDDANLIVVTGAGLPAASGDRAYSVVTINRERLEGVASGRLEDALRDVSGFGLFRRSDARSGHPTSMGATLRGLGGNASSRALLLLDGVPQADPFGGWVAWPAYSPMRMGAARVTRGGGTGANGAGALAGTIELMSAGANDLTPLWGAVAYGSRDSVDAQAGLSGAIGGGFASLSAGYARGDGFIPVIASQRGPADVPADYEQYSVAVRGVAPLGADTELQVNGLAFVDNRTRGTAYSDNRTVGADASLRLVGRGHWGWEAVGYLQTREFDSGFASVNAGRTVASPTLDQYNTPATGVGGRLELRPPVGEAIQLRLGADGRVNSGVTKELFSYSAGKPTRIRNAGGRTTTLGAFAEATVEAGDQLTLTASGRIDHWRISNGHLYESPLTTGATVRNDFDDRSGDEPTARAGIAFHPTDAITLRGAGYIGWRLPTLNELYRPFRVGADVTNANENLNPETMRGVEAGADFQPATGVRLGATLFWNKLNDAIGNVTVSSTGASVIRKRQNLDAVRSRGVEVEAEATMNQWHLLASYAYTDARVRTSGPALALNGLRPAQTPRHTASGTVAWASAPDGFGAALTARYVAPQFEDDQNSRTLNDALTFDANLRFPLVQKLSLELRGENLTDHRIEAGISGAGIIERASPRTLWVGLRYGGR